jgi:hypothetical protein
VRRPVRPVTRWQTSSRTADPAMAVSQVERLKNPGREWMWKSLVATQPPPGRVPAALRIRGESPPATGLPPGSSRELNFAPAQINPIRTVAGPSELDPAAAPNGGS